MTRTPSPPRRLLRVVAVGGGAAGKRALAAGLPELGIAVPSDDDTRSLLAAAATADVALILVDAAVGIEATTRRHSVLAALLGVRHVALIVDAVSLTDGSEAAFRRLEGELRELAAAVGLVAGPAIPVSSGAGDNVRQRSSATPWYTGPTIVAWLEGLEGDAVRLPGAPAEIADQFEVTVFWLGAAPMLRGRGYQLQLGTQTAIATVSPLKYKLEPTTLARLTGPTLAANEIGVCNLQLDRALAFEPYRVSREMGGFILLDRLSGDTVGVGTLHFALRRAQNVHRQALDVTKAARAALKGQRPCVLWYTGLSGAGKSTIANLVDKTLHAAGRHTYLLDGDNVRHGLNRDLGFTDADRVENIRRIAEVAKLMVDAGLIVSAAFISPFRTERHMARALMGDGEFIEIFVHTPLSVAEQRDPKGLYKKARRGELKNFTGIDSPYEPPEHPELKIDTTSCSPEDAAETIVAFLRARGIVAAD